MPTPPSVLQPRIHQGPSSSPQGFSHMEEGKSHCGIRIYWQGLPCRKGLGTVGPTAVHASPIPLLTYVLQGVLTALPAGSLQSWLTWGTEAHLQEVTFRGCYPPVEVQSNTLSCTPPLPQLLGPAWEFSLSWAWCRHTRPLPGLAASGWPTGPWPAPRWSRYPMGQ